MYKTIKKCIIRGYGCMMKWQTYYRTKFLSLANVCDESVSLSVNCVGAVDDSKKFDTTAVRNDFYLIYVLKGSMNIEYGQECEVIKEGEILVLSPGTEYHYTASENSGINYLWLHFTGSDVKNMLLGFDIPLNRICKVGYSGGILDCWKKMCKEFVIDDKYFSCQTNALLTEIFGKFARRINKNSSATRLLNSVLYIHENYYKKINVAKLAQMEGLSEPHYRALFVKNYGKSPVDYITERRIDAIVHLLENSDKKLEEIAVLTGYCDAYYMTKQFKKFTGTTPGKYRRNL